MKAVVVALAGILRFAVSVQAAEIAHPSFAGPLPPVAPVGASQVSSTIDPRDAHAKADAPSKGAVDPGDERHAAPVKIKVEPQQASQDTAKPRPEMGRRDAGRPHVCFNAAETRETVAAHRLSEPFRALRAGRQQGEALRAKLCKWKQDEFVYEIFVLRRDGRIVRVYMNAQSGQAVGALDSNDRH